MKHPTASADLAGSGNVRNHDSDFMRGIERDLAEPMDGDALAGSHMASDMVRHVHLDPSTVSTLAGALEAQRLRNDPDARKPWVEPTVTECATTNRRPATLTIAGVDLPNPAPPAPRIAPTAAEILNAVGWLRNRAGLQPVRTAEFESIARITEGLGAEIVRQAAEIAKLRSPTSKPGWYIPPQNQQGLPTQSSNGELYFDQLVSEIPDGWASDGYVSRMHEVADMAAIGRSLIGVIAEITRPGGEGCEGLKGWAPADSPIEIITDLLNMINGRNAEISELQGMLKEAIGPVRFVSELATLTDTEVDFMGVGEIRATARGKIGEPYGFTLPRLYSEEDRKRAVAEYLRRFAGPEDHAAPRVDVIAEALGLQRAS